MNDVAPISASYEVGRAALFTALREVRDSALAPSPRLTLSEWACRHGRLSAESSAEPGEFTPYGYQRGMMDAMTDPAIAELYIQKATRTGLTQTAAFALGYYLDQDPTKILFALPTEQDVSDFTKDTLLPLFRDTPSLAAIVGGGIADDDKLNKFTSKGSVLHLRGAHSADSFRRLTARILIADELDADGWDFGGKSQGDKLKLMLERGKSYWNRKLIAGSTPTIAGASRIEKRFLEGDQRRYFVPCPHCGEFQYLEWGSREEPWGVKWPKDQPELAYYVCRHNGCVIEEHHKPWMDDNGGWRATAVAKRPRVASMHISALYSLFVNASWGRLAEEFVAAARLPHGVERQEAFRSFSNLNLGETYEETEARQLTPHDLCARLEIYTAEVPEGVLFLTAGVDTQTADGGRFEVSVYGWGANGERWLIGHWILKDHPLADPRSWSSLEALLRRPFRTTTGHQIYIQGACIDSGGTYTQEVYAFTGRQPPRLRWWAIKGRNNAKGERSSDGVWPKTPTKTGLGSLLHLVDVDTAKDTLVRQLAAESGETGCFHWPSAALPGSAPIDDLFFTRLTREKQRAAPGRPGRTYWTSPTDQEPWDCLVYAYAAMMGLCSIPNNPWSRMVAIRTEPAAGPVAEAAPVAAVPAAGPRQAVPPPAPAPAPAPRPAAKPKQKIITSPFMRRR